MRLATTLALALTALPVAAQSGAATDPAPADDAALAEARQRFREATELEREGRWSEATAKLRAALDVRETPGLRFHLAYCEEHQGHYVEALTNYRRAKAMIEAGAAAEDVAELVGPALERVESQVVRLKIELKTQAESPALRVDGRAFELGGVLELNPGPHQLEVTAPGYQSLTRSVYLRPGTVRLPLRLERRPEETASVPPQPESEPPKPAVADLNVERSEGISGKTWALVIESVVLGGAIAAGIGFSLRADRAQENADLTRSDLQRVGADCQRASGAILTECSALRDFEQSSEDAQLFSTLSFVGAGVTAGALVVTALLWPSSKPQRSARTIVPVGPRASWGFTTQYEF
ncbi:MAG: hypothetical protein AB7K71_18555 [Polyangiaceae bacterium]